MATLISDLEAFLQEHRRCGEMDAGVEDDRVWMTWDGCDGELSRPLLRIDSSLLDQL
jgi:hypothetical protein